MKSECQPRLSRRTCVGKPQIGTVQRYQMNRDAMAKPLPASAGRSGRLSKLQTSAFLGSRSDNGLEGTREPSTSSNCFVALRASHPTTAPESSQLGCLRLDSVLHFHVLQPPGLGLSILSVGHETTGMLLLEAMAQWHHPLLHLTRFRGMESLVAPTIARYACDKLSARRLSVFVVHTVQGGHSPPTVPPHPPSAAPAKFMI